VPLVHSALSDPPSDGVLLLQRQLSVCELRRHDFLVGREDALDDFAFVRIAGHDRETVGVRRSERFLANVQTHACHARAFVGSVAAEAGIGHDRPYVAIEADLVRISARESVNRNNGHGNP